MGEEVSVKGILDKVLGIELAKQTVQLASRVGRILVGLGWKKIRKRIDGIRQYLYCRENSDRLYDEQCDPEDTLAKESLPAHSVSDIDTECAGKQLLNLDAIAANPLTEIESVTKTEIETEQEIPTTEEYPVTRIPVTGESEAVVNSPPDKLLQCTKVLSRQIKGLLVLEDVRQLFQLRDENLDIWQDAIARLNPDKRSQLTSLLEEVRCKNNNCLHYLEIIEG